jgi:hypothetical protein
MTNAYSETGEMAVCCQNMMLGALSNRSTLSMLVGVLFKQFGLCLNTPHIIDFWCSVKFSSFIFCTENYNKIWCSP